MNKKCQRLPEFSFLKFLLQLSFVSAIELILMELIVVLIIFKVCVKFYMPSPNHSIA